MDYFEFIDNQEVQNASKEYLTRFGGRFFCEEPGDTLLYLPEDGSTEYTPPENHSADKLIHDLPSGKNLSELWELPPPYDPDCDY